jgi:hypothetical protein
MNVSVADKVQKLMERELRAREEDGSFWDSLRETHGIGKVWGDTCSGLYTARDMSEMANANPGASATASTSTSARSAVSSGRWTRRGEIMTHDELGMKAVFLGGVTKECLEALPLMSEDIRTKFVRFLIGKIEMSQKSADSILIHMLFMDVGLAFEMTQFILREAKDDNPRATWHLFSSKIVCKWVKQNEPFFERKRR